MNRTQKEFNNTVKSNLIIFILTAIVFTSILSGCTESRPRQQEPVNRSSKPYTIGVSFPTTRLVYRSAMKELIDSNYPETGGQSRAAIRVYDANGSQRKQNEDILKMVDSGVDGIILIPGTMEGCLSAVEYAATKGVPVITVDNRIRNSASAPVLSFVGSDHYAMGADAAKLFLQILEEQFPEKEEWNIIQLSGIPDSSGTIDRGQAISDTLAQNDRIHLLGTYDGEFTVANAKSVMEDCLAIYRTIDGVICQNDNMAEGCYQALKEAGKAGEVVVVGIDGQKSTLAIMAEGGIHGTVLQHPSMILDGIEYLCDYLDGTPLPATYFTVTDIIDTDNVHDYLEHDLSW